jgi:hypothetical protein
MTDLSQATRLSIAGMSCAGCVASVEGARAAYFLGVSALYESNTAFRIRRGPLGQFDFRQCFFRRRALSCEHNTTL